MLEKMSGAGGGFRKVMSHIFISYNQDDADFAAVLMMELEKAGFDTWLDKHRLRAGADWSDEIDTGIRTASALVLVLSPSSRASEYVTYEWSCAIGAGIRVVPVLRRETEIHPRLRRLQYLDFRGSVRPWSDLVRELQSIKQESQTHWRPPRDAPPHIQRAVNDLDSGNRDDRRGALAVIVESEHSVAHLALQHALTSPFRDVRGPAAVALAARDDPAITTEIGIRGLAEAWFDSNQWESAGATLSRMGRAAFDHLSRLAKSKMDVVTRAAATDHLSKTGGKEAIPPLLELMEDSDRLVAVCAIEQLGQLKVVQAIPGIMHRMVESATKDYETPSARSSTTMMTDDWTKPSLLKVVAAAVEALVGIGDKSIEPELVAATRHQVPTVRMCAGQVLLGLCGAAAIPVLANLLSDSGAAHYIDQNSKASFEAQRTVAEVVARSLERANTPEAQELVLHYRREHPR